MADDPAKNLRTGFTTGACATAAVAAAAGRLMTGVWVDPVEITLPKGQIVEFSLAHKSEGDGWVEAGVLKDAGDDPDVTHGVVVIARVERGAEGSGITFAAGEGVGHITRPGLPIPVGDPAINPVPRQMMVDAIDRIAQAVEASQDFKITISIPDGAAIAKKTWNPRLGIEGGLSILGTTGIVRPFSCSAWIASIHRGVDVARAAGLQHVCGATGNTSEATAQLALNLPDHAMLDMGDFAGGLLKYLRKHPIDRLTIAGGFGKLTKLAQGALDLHSGRSQVDFDILSEWVRSVGGPYERARNANTAMEVLEMSGPIIAEEIAKRAARTAADVLGDAPVRANVMVVSRSGAVLAASGS